MPQLNQKQISELAQYIQSRGASFKEPRILTEVLDHFVCKVEEIWTAEPNLSFEEAKISAHKSFGVRGFKPIADATIESVELQFARYGKQLESNFLKSYRIVICVLCSICLYGFLYKVGPNWISRSVVLGLYIAHCFIYFRSIPKELKNSIYLVQPKFSIAFGCKHRGFHIYHLLPLCILL